VSIAPGSARESPLYRLLEPHIEEPFRVWPERFARKHGPLPPVVERVLRAFLECGLAEQGRRQEAQASSVASGRPGGTLMSP